MNIDLNWLIGRRIKELQKKDFTWLVLLDDGSTITTESLWRLITDNGIKISSDDHGQKFGLSAPLDAIKIMKETIGQKTIKEFKLDSRSGDLSILFDNADELQFLNDSSGYESWHIVHGNQEVICMGGGKLHEMDKDK